MKKDILKNAFFRNTALSLALVAPMSMGLTATNSLAAGPEKPAASTQESASSLLDPQQERTDLTLKIDGKPYPCPELDTATRHDPKLRQKYMKQDPDAFTKVETLKDLCFSRFKEAHPDPVAPNPLNTPDTPGWTPSSPPWFRI